MSTLPSELLSSTMNSFFDAVINEDVTTASKILSENTESPELSVKRNINFLRPEDGMTALHHAATAQTDKLVKLLIANEAEPKIVDSDGRTAVHLAAKGGKLENLKALVAKNRDLINSVDLNGSTPLHLASFHGRTTVVAWLITEMPDINLGDNASLAKAIYTREQSKKVPFNKDEIQKIQQACEQQKNTLLAETSNKPDAAEMSETIRELDEIASFFSQPDMGVSSKHLLWATPPAAPAIPDSTQTLTDANLVAGSKAPSSPPKQS